MSAISIHGQPTNSSLSRPWPNLGLYEENHKKLAARIIFKYMTGGYFLQHEDVGGLA